MCASEFQVVTDTLTGHREVDESVLEAMAVLDDRLERVRSFGGSFARIGFSSEAVHLLHDKSLVAVG